ncbi:bacterial regulatory helix-turn-helix, lysR family protein [Burkholderia thailandensis 34]|uniref:LysR substrate-binding domain-containing protein n=1 Tax=Burkholderia thailandensis TaxID=57975 RepID=UPI0005D775F2|nr:LysR substrate-binding domain-containing protein [Burkholderia thailandensis]AJY28981.1 bacterial regulatory helix-turn-helix, lysR family protein [Burkholderia thailandensis 34]AOJ56025.1 LysR family transcriptional regulator [Burkholderia thailandensis]KXF59968.1 LysR family transcriptional regulator [Burkholderia thailandensis]PNE75976.1 LysR family transcriptional regulator [Burkholderia thailandensis]
MNAPSDSAAMSLDIVLLRTFLEVADSRGFAPAAERLALTPSAVSGHIKRLEQATGAVLLARTTRRVELTHAGETLYAYARNIVELEREARARLRGSPLHGRLRVGASEDFAGAWLPQVLHAFGRLHPRATIELKVGVTADLLRQQASGRLDVVFGKHCSRIDDKAGELLWEEPLVWAFASDAALDANDALPLALFPEPCVYREAALAALSDALRPFRIAFESGSMAGCVSAALAGFAVTVVARSQLRDGLRECGPNDALPALPAARFHAFAHRPTPAGAALIEAVRETGRRRRFMSTH